MGDPMNAISIGALQRIANNEAVPNPVVQCLQIKQLAANPNAQNNQDRYRTVFSDTRNFIQAMLGTSMNHLVTSDQLKKGMLVRLNTYNTSTVKDRVIIVALDVEVLEQYGEQPKIGEPVAMDNSTDGVKAESQEPKHQASAISTTGFYGNKPPAPQNTSVSNRSNGYPASTTGNIYPIEALSPYAHKWTIKARVTHKSDIKTWHNKNGEGRLFSVTLMDESGEIRATGFNDQVDMLYEMLQDGSAYYISAPCAVKLAKKQFSNVNNDYELTFERDTKVEKCEDQESVPQIKYNFTNLQALQSTDNGAIVDVIGILDSVGEVNQITSKTTSKPYDKRELNLVDNSGFSVRLTIWGNTATQFDANPESVVAFKGVKVSDFGGRSLSLLSSGSLTVDPDIDTAHQLKGWYDAQGRTEKFESHANVMGTTNATGRKNDSKTIQTIKDEQLGMSDERDYFTLKATVVYIKADNIAYPACQTEGCNKKIVEINAGEWRCEKCDKSFESPKYRYILQMNVSDHTGQLWLSCFDEVGRLVIGMDANEMMRLQEENGQQFTANKLAEAACQQWSFRCSAKMDTFQDQQRVRYTVATAGAINFVQEAHRLTELIKQYDINEDSMFVN